MYNFLISPFVEFEFMRRALVGAIALALAGSPLGVFLLLRRMALTGDAMAHAILPGAAMGYLAAGLSLGPMTVGGFIAGLIVAVGSGVVARTTILREDASMAAFYLISLALGVTVISLRGSNIDLLHVLFGSVLALDDATLLLLASIATLTLIGLAFLYRPLVMETVDPGFLASVGNAGGPTQILFLMLVVLNLVGGFHALGTLLAVGMMMLPAAAARLIAKDIGSMIALAAAQGVLASYAGLIISFYAGLPSGPLIILIAGALYLLALAFGPAGGVLRRLRSRRHLEA
ncbi:Zinc ABC transporter permease [Methylocella tundrae]|uniref:Zinc ABC transporter permease n=1 Tax=Methylocella tundrae TaxID=227605 RepID=A0A4U8Z4J7_METTU|nr:Zinc ABC transporter permease [Methylocella tundrae]VTZ49288.1 Zinc ABC transporter permease [Methylocella tundrae]